MKQTEFRSCNGKEFRTVDNEQGEKIIEGHAAVFNRQTNVGDWFYEVIDANAFDKTDLRDVPLIVNHDYSKIPLARSRRNNGNSTLTLAVDEVGLSIRAKLDVENNADAKALYSAVERGDLDGMSFAFNMKNAAPRWLHNLIKVQTLQNCAPCKNRFKILTAILNNYAPQYKKLMNVQTL